MQTGATGCVPVGGLDKRRRLCFEPPTLSRRFDRSVAVSLASVAGSGSRWKTRGRGGEAGCPAPSPVPAGAPKGRSRWPAPAPARRLGRSATSGRDGGTEEPSREGTTPKGRPSRTARTGSGRAESTQPSGRDDRSSPPPSGLRAGPVHRDGNQWTLGRRPGLTAATLASLRAARVEAHPAVCEEARDIDSPHTHVSHTRGCPPHAEPCSAIDAQIWRRPSVRGHGRRNS